MGTAAEASRPVPGLGASLVKRKRQELGRMPVNDPRHPGIHGERKAELSAYAREEMRIGGGIRVHDPEEQKETLEPWQLRGRWRWGLEG